MSSQVVLMWHSRPRCVLAVRPLDLPFLITVIRVNQW